MDLFLFDICTSTWGLHNWSPQSKLRNIPSTCFGIVCTNDAIIEDNHSSTHRSIPFQTRSHRVCLTSRVSNIISCSHRQRQDCPSDVDSICDVKTLLVGTLHFAKISRTFASDLGGTRSSPSDPCSWRMSVFLWVRGRKKDKISASTTTGARQRLTHHSQGEPRGTTRKSSQPRIPTQNAICATTPRLLLERVRHAADFRGNKTAQKLGCLKQRYVPRCRPTFVLRASSKATHPGVLRGTWRSHPP